jgi:hypothetical protein
MIVTTKGHQQNLYISMNTFYFDKTRYYQPITHTMPFLLVSLYLNENKTSKLQLCVVD